MKKIKLQADTARGVYEVEEFEFTPFTDEQDFFEYLDHVNTNEMVCCEVSEDMYKLIDDKYGIR